MFVVRCYDKMTGSSQQTLSELAQIKKADLRSPWLCVGCGLYEIALLCKRLRKEKASCESLHHIVCHKALSLPRPGPPMRMEASGTELWLCVLIGAAGATLLMVGWSGSHLSWSVGLVVEVMLCCWIWNESVAVILLSALCGCCIMYFSAGGKEDMLPVQGKAVLVTGEFYLIKSF